MVHAATVCSTIVMNRHKFANLCSLASSPSGADDDFYYVCKILVSCIPVGIVGVFFKRLRGSGFSEADSPWWESACASQPCFWHSPYFSGFDRRTGKVVSGERGRDIGWLDAFVIGCAQAVAVLPDLSRSGTTIATGILIGDKRDRVASVLVPYGDNPDFGEAPCSIRPKLSSNEGRRSRQRRRGHDWP